MYVKFWSCPVDAHGQRRDDSGRAVVTVEWDGDVAHCTAPGCTLNSDPAGQRIEVSEYVAFPSYSEGVSIYGELTAEDFAVTIQRAADGWRIVHKGKLYSRKSYEFELVSRDELYSLQDSPEHPYRLELDEAKRVAPILADQVKINGKNFHEWRLAAEVDKRAFEEDPTNIVVRVNGESFDTYLDEHGTQRFVGEAKVRALVDSLVGPSMESPATRLLEVQGKLDDSLLSHPNPIVRKIAQVARSGEVYSLNEVAVAMHLKEFTLDDYIEFNTLHGYSVGGFIDCISSMLSNLGFNGAEENELFVVENPLWA